MVQIRRTSSTALLASSDYKLKVSLSLTLLASEMKAGLFCRHQLGSELVGIVPV